MTEPKSPIKCSRAGCVATATDKIHWRNPKLHGPERIKTWLACDEHLSYLVEYLQDRAFFIGSEKI
jgi:hypothetical protein